MIISRTPYRISFFGGGTDYPGWYLKHGGAVLATAIDQYCYLTLRYLPPFFDHKYRIVYSKCELCNTIDKIEHPAVREALKLMNTDRGMEIHHDGDLPARSGVGSSSSFAVGLINALNALDGQFLSPDQLAKRAIFLEQDCLHENVGSQDQVSAAYGGFNLIHFHQSGEFDVNPMTISQQRLDEFQNHVMLFYTGVARYSSDVAASYALDIATKEKQLFRYTEMITEATHILKGSSCLSEFGELMDEAWRLKRSLSSAVSNNTIDLLYDVAINAGASGGKLVGAGGGGFLLLIAKPECHERVRKALGNLLEIPFNFDFRGSQVIYYDHLEKDKNQGIGKSKKELFEPRD